MPTKRAQVQETLTHTAGRMLQQMQRHRGVRSQRRGRRCRRRCGAGGNTLSSITQTHRTKKTRHALNARHRIAACNAGSMRANPCLTPPFPCTVCAAAVWMGRTCERSRDGCLVLPRRTQTRSGLVVIIRPQRLLYTQRPGRGPGRTRSHFELPLHTFERPAFIGGIRIQLLTKKRTNTKLFARYRLNTVN